MDILGLFLYQHWIQGIIIQALPKTKELPEIYCSYLTSEKELATLLPSRKFLKVVILSDIG